MEKYTVELKRNSINCMHTSNYVDGNYNLLQLQGRVVTINKKHFISYCINKRLQLMEVGER